MGGDSIRVICGPTAAGKSAIALLLAERHGALIIGADSRQIYRGFDVGTAKPTPRDQTSAPHRGIDIADPTERYSAARWSEVATRAITESQGRGLIPLLVGGSGFYLRALFAPLFAEPAIEPARRARLQRELALLPAAELRRWCAALDPALAHLGKTQLLRATEIALLTGTRLSQLRMERSRPPRFSARYLLIDPGDTLQHRIADRVDAMLASGWEAEVRDLTTRVPADAPAWNACGYGAIRRLCDGGVDRQTAAQAVVIATRQYAKRQRTWFRHQLSGAAVTRLDPAAADADAIVERWWNNEATL